MLSDKCWYMELIFPAGKNGYICSGEITENIRQSLKRPAKKLRVTVTWEEQTKNLPDVCHERQKV